MSFFSGVTGTDTSSSSSFVLEAAAKACLISLSLERSASRLALAALSRSETADEAPVLFPPRLALEDPLY